MAAHGARSDAVRLLTNFCLQVVDSLMVDQRQLKHFRLRVSVKKQQPGIGNGGCRGGLYRASLCSGCHRLVWLWVVVLQRLRVGPASLL